MKKLLSIIACLVLLTAAVFAFASCTKPEAPHVHDYAAEVTVAPTCTDKGLMTYTCSCGKSYTENVVPKGHTEQIDLAVAPTCTESGLTEGTHCFDCGLVFKPQVEVAPLGHKPGAPATCTQDQVCANGCGKVFVEASGHSALGAPATCTEDQLCGVCGEVAVEKLGHDEVVMEAVAPTCFETGRTEGSYCKRCNVVLTEQEVVPARGHVFVSVVTEPDCINKGYTTHTCDCGLYYVDSYTDIVDHPYKPVVTDPTCTEMGYTTYTCPGCKDSYVTDIVKALGHNYDTATVENDDGFGRYCANGCGTYIVPTDVIADSYKANISLDYTSDRANELIIRYNKGINGITYCNGTHMDIPDAGDQFLPGLTDYYDVVGKFDKKGKTITYEFVVDKDGYVDLIWHISSGGIDNMADYIAITIDGKPVDINGLALPAGDDVNYSKWWYMHKFVLEDVALEAGVHTFTCTINESDAVVNIGHMEIRSNRNVSVREAIVNDVDLVLENDKVYYVISGQFNGFDLSTLRLYHDIAYLNYEMVSCETVDGITTMKFDVTRHYKLYPHLEIEGIKYVNAANVNGDLMLDVETKTVERDGRIYKIAMEHSMPSLSVEMLSDTATNIELKGSDIYVEDGNVWWTFTYGIEGYYPEYLQIFDESTNYEQIIVDNGDGTYTFKIDLSGYDARKHNPHLRVNNSTWTGAGHNQNGDIKPDIVDQKTVEFDGRIYLMRKHYGMSTVEIVNKSDKNMINYFCDVEVIDNRAYLILKYVCTTFDPTKAEFYDGSLVLKYNMVEEYPSAYIYYIDITDTTKNFYAHLRIEGQNWCGKDNVSSSNGDIKTLYDATNSWVTIKMVSINGKNYVLGDQYYMVVIGH